MGASQTRKFWIGRRRCTRSACTRSLLIVLSLAFCWCLSYVGAQEELSCAPPSSHTYPWEAFDYYQILDLSPPQQENNQPRSRKQRRKERAKYKSSDIRKAYRKQAQLYHPDKLASKRQTEGGNSTNLTQEESTARFARIAEAYEVLNDQGKRYEYDAFLLDCEDQLVREAALSDPGGGAGRTDSRWSFLDDLSTDPWRVFEDFFFGSPFEQAGGADGSEWDDDAHDKGQYTEFHTPRRVYEREEFHYDPYRGVEILRIFQTEEYDVDPRSNSYYYRVIGQDFVEQHDPFYGWEYHPINQPFVVEEGYRRDQEYSSFGSSHFDNSSRQFDDRLLPGEMLYPSSEPLLTSSNGRFYAGISPECELLIMSDSFRLGSDVDDKLVWSSETFVPAAQLVSAGGCFLSLRGPRLVLALGNAERPGSILWHSEVPHAQEAMAQPDPSWTYFARLDNDGSLAVYYSEPVDPGSSSFSETNHSQRSRLLPLWWSKVNIKLGNYSWWTSFVEKTNAVPRTRAAKAWVSCRNWVGRKVMGRKGESSGQHSKSDSNKVTQETCVYATGLAGCNSSARKLLHMASDVKHSVSHGVRHTKTRIDKVMDGFTDYLNEEIEEDEDVLDTLLRVLGAAGRGIGKVGTTAARRGAKVVRDSIEEHLYRLKRREK